MQGGRRSRERGNLPQVPGEKKFGSTWKAGKDLGRRGIAKEEMEEAQRREDEKEIGISKDVPDS